MASDQQAPLSTDRRHPRPSVSIALVVVGYLLRTRVVPGPGYYRGSDPLVGGSPVALLFTLPLEPSLVLLGRLAPPRTRLDATLQEVRDSQGTL